MKREKLFRNPEWWIASIQNDLYAIIYEYMGKNNLNKTQLAEKLQVTKGYITQVLNGDFDHKISKLVDLALSSGKVPIVHFVDLEQYIKDDANDKEHIYHQDFYDRVTLIQAEESGNQKNKAGVNGARKIIQKSRKPATGKRRQLKTNAKHLKIKGF